MASDVVYGNDPSKWTNLIQTMRDLSGPNTLVLIANVQRYPIHHPSRRRSFTQSPRLRILKEANYRYRVYIQTSSARVPETV